MGVVNVSEVMSRYSRTGDLQKLHDGRFSARRQELLKRQQDLMKKAADLGTAEDADSPDRYAQIKALEREKFLIEQEGQVFQHDVKVAREKVMRLLQEEVRVACRRIAGQEGYDLILKVQESDPSQGGDRARIEAFEMSAVLYAAPSVDITARVLSFLEEAGRRGIRLAPEDLVRDATGGEAAR
jgi:Skp family chaperone for outer membrane proteins